MRRGVKDLMDEQEFLVLEIGDLRRALERIASLDYRGPEPEGRRIAREALGQLG